MTASWNNLTIAAFLSLVRVRTVRVRTRLGEHAMDSIVYLVGLVVIVMLILSVLGLR